MRIWLDAEGTAISKKGLGFRDLGKPKAQFDVTVSVAKPGKDKLTLHVPYYYCQEDGTGLCKAGQLAWTIPIEVADSGDVKPVDLSFDIKD